MVITGNHRLTWGNASLNMADHRAVGLATLDASRDAGNRWIFPDLVDEGLEPWNGVKLVLIAGSPEASHAVDVSDHIDAGIESLKRHKVYIENLGGDFRPDSFLKDIASWAGAELGVAYAVKFELIRI